MKRFLLLPFFCLTAWGAAAQATNAATFDYAALHPLAKQVFLPVFGLYLLCAFVLNAVKMVLSYLLKRQIIAAGVSESIVERLLPGPQDERDKVVKWTALLLSTGAGLTACYYSMPLGIHSIIILVFSTALGFLAYYFYLRHQAQ